MKLEIENSASFLAKIHLIYLQRMPTMRKAPQGKSIQMPTISQGTATPPVHSRDIDELIKIADRALYRAQGKSRVQYRIAEASSP